MPKQLLPLFACLLFCLIGMFAFLLFISQYDRYWNYWKPHAFKVQLFDSLAMGVCLAAILLLVLPDQPWAAIICPPVWIIYYVVSFAMDREFRKLQDRWLIRTFDNLLGSALRSRQREKTHETIQKLLGKRDEPKP